MKLLLDTHVWIWTQEAVEKLGPETEALLVDPRSTLVVSPISTLEIARLLALGGLRLKGRLETWVNDTLAALAAQTQEVSHQIARVAYSLPEPFHRDPADRLLVATARCHALTLVTADERILAYPHVRSQDART